MLYQTYQAQRDVMAPVKQAATFTARFFAELPDSIGSSPAVRWVSASSEMLARSGLTHTRPSFGIDEVSVHGVPIAVREEIVDTTPFGTLLHFAKETDVPEPRILVVAAMAGHFSTLLRSTVRALLDGHDVYITDWHNARDIPVTEGTFGFDEYVDHVVRFIHGVGTGAHVLAVCQPCPATLAAVAVMAEAGDPAVPRSLTLMAGPVDGRISPTVVNELAGERPLSWFEDNVITSVPWRYRGAGRRVYPGFLQLGSFVAMNWANHVDQHLNLFHYLVTGDDEKAETIKTFYDEYRAVLDLPAEFYLETVDRVFQRFLLARGELDYRGRRVDPSAITRTALLTVEGGRDDICGMGQTMAAQDLCTSIPATKRLHHLQAGVGHYGVFSGSAWERQICPVVRNFVLSNQ